MIDLHCHILPGVDDGASMEEESCMMASLAMESGVTAIAATPHCNVPGQPGNYAGPELLERFRSLSEALKRNKIPVQLCHGMEVYMTPTVPELIRRNKLLTLGGSRYLLVEFGFDQSFEFAEDMLRAVQQEGLTPVVAHPERYDFVQRDQTRLLHWLREGWVLQINKGSLLGMFGRRAARTAHWCLDEGCVHLIGSDAHSPFRRTPRMGEIWEYTADFTTPAIADFLLRDNPSRILRDQPVRPVLAEF